VIKTEPQAQSSVKQEPLDDSVAPDGLRAQWEADLQVKEEEDDDDPGEEQYPEDDADELAATAHDGARVELHEGALRTTRPGGATEVIAQAWPRDIAPVAVASSEGRARVVVFGNGTVLRRP
jgi:hypothetical protein